MAEAAALDTPLDIARAKVLGDVPRLLEAYRPRTLGLDVERLLADVERVLAEVWALGPGRIGEFDRELVPRLVVEVGEAP